MSTKPEIAIIGAGPAGLMAAEIAARGGASVTIFDRMPSPGRKLLLAGRGGLNLTHSEGADRFLSRYGAAAGYLDDAIRRFGPGELRDWSRGLGIDTFVGTSGRVFPVSFKTSPLLRAWLRRLDATGVRFRMRHRWTGWAGDGRLCFETPDGNVRVATDAMILALGGASWPQLGTDGAWVGTLQAAGVEIAPLRPANCGFVTSWSEIFRDRFEGQPLKNVALAFDGQVARGDAMVSRAGLEGGPVYALAPHLREAIARSGQALCHVALRPDLAESDIAVRLGKRRPKESLSNVLRKTLGLAPVAIGLLREAMLPPGITLTMLAPSDLARLVNAVPVMFEAPMPLERAISTAGGIPVNSLDAAFMLRPGLFVAGEMVDWEAPTGGYLLQACFATGVVAAEGALAWLARQDLKVEEGARPHIMV